MTSGEESHTPTPRRPWSLSVIVKNITSGWAGLVVGIAFAFVLAPLTVRTLGNVYYGVWTLLMQLTGYLWLFDFGVRESVVKYVAQYHAADDHARINSTVNTAVSIYSLVSAATLALAVSLAIALPYIFNIPPDAVPTARITALLVGGTVAQVFVFNVFIGVVAGLQRFYVLNRLGLVIGILRSLATYALLTRGYGIVMLASMQFAVTLLQNLITFRFARSLLPYLRLELSWPKKDEAVTLLNYGKYVLLANVGDKIVFATDSLVVGTYLPVSALTHYAIGGSLIEYMRSFVTSMAAVMNPLTSTLEARQESRALAVAAMAGTRAAVLLGLPLCVGFMTLGKTFIRLWMGAEYVEPAGDVLFWLAAGHAIGLPYYTISGVLYGLNRHRIVAYSRLLEGAVNLLLSLILVRVYGVVGVAVGTVIPHAMVVAGILPPVLTRWVPFRLRDYYVSTYLRPLAASLPFSAACWLIATRYAPQDLLTFFAVVGTSLVLYVVPCWLMVLTAEERSLLATALRRRRPQRTAEEMP